MFRILEKQRLADNLVKLVIEAPRASRSAQAGQFAIIKISEKGERVPLTIADRDAAKGSVTIIAQEVGATTRYLGSLKAGDSIEHFLAPLGHPSEIENFGTCCVIGGGVGIAEILPQVRALKEAGNKVITIIGARTQKLLILESELRALSSELYVMTDDGSYGEKGFVTQKMEEIIKREPVNRIFAVGPVPMMAAVVKATKPHNIKTIVSLNPIMLDATGMCGVCRVVVGGKVKFACVDGPEFDGHEVDFQDLTNRLSTYIQEESSAKEHVCKVLGVKM